MTLRSALSTNLLQNLISGDSSSPLGSACQINGRKVLTYGDRHSTVSTALAAYTQYLVLGCSLHLTSKPCDSNSLIYVLCDVLSRVYSAQYASRRLSVSPQLSTTAIPAFRTASTCSNVQSKIGTELL